ncbi:hypothetical protein BHM03_00052124 [Ensete ventricosum]|nr:hypothetical protein BHM03_00052124 [Ensete ventricosum]
MDDKSKGLKREIADLRARTPNWASALEDELLKLTGALEKLTVELPAETIAEYKKLTGFEMGLVRTCQVSYKYGYRVVLAKFKA